MKRTKFADEQFICILGEHEAGAKCADLCRKHGMSGGTFHIYGRLPQAFRVGRRSMRGADIYPASPVDVGAPKWSAKHGPQQMAGLSGLYKSQGLHAPGVRPRGSSPLSPAP